MEQFEQLLTCAICLDRYRNPKLLPCQHSFCMEPCLDGLIDYVRRQVKCPECRAEHRIPYQGVQGYPTNVTLQRFLELHIEITGEMPDPTSGQIMKRCAVCTEKAYCIHCNHCYKDVCPQCKAAHMDILRREITRINNQVRRAIHRLEDILGMVEKNTLALQLNCTSVSEEVEEIYRRLSKALKDRADYLRGEIDRYLSIELRNLNTLKENLETELANIQANCDLADKYMQSEDVEWEDIELMDTKEIFMKTVDFIRNFEAEMGDYTRRVRFAMAHDPNQLVMHVSTFGDLNISIPHSFTNAAQQLQAGPGLMRSKSDHRLAAPYRQQDDRYDREESGRVSPLNGRKFGERYPARRQEREYDYGGDYEESRPSARSRIRSRLRHQGENTDSDNDTGGGGRMVRFTEGQGQQKERERVLDTEDLTRGPLSGIFRLYDSPRVMQRLQETEIKKDRPPPPPPAQQQQAAAKPQTPKRVTATQRQISEEDEITKIKKQMKNAPGEPREQLERPGAERVAALRREEDRSTSPQSNRSSPGSDNASAQSKPIVPAVSQGQGGASSSDESDDSPPASLSQGSAAGQSRKTSVTRQTSVPQNASRRSSASSDHSSPVAGQYLSPTSATTTDHRSNSLDSNASSADTGSSTTSSSQPRTTGAVFTTDEVKRMLSRGANGLTTPATPNLSTSATASHASTPQEPPRFHSRFLRGGSRAVTGVTTAPNVVQKQTTKEENEDEETSSEEESSSEESDSDDQPPTGGSSKTGEMAKTDIGPLLARSAQARKSSREETSYTPQASKYASYGREDSSTTSQATAPWRSRAAASASVVDDDSSSRHTGFTSRFLNKSKSSAAVSPEEEDPGYGRRFGTSSSAGGTSAATSASASSPRSRYAALKDRKARLARSRSSHNLGDDDDDDDVVAANSPAAYLANKYGSDLSRSRSSHTIKSREPSPERPSASGSSASAVSVGEKDGAALSSWARYLKNKYGARGKDGSTASSVSNSRRLSLGLPLRSETSDDDQKNSPASPTSPTQHPLHQGFAVGSSTRGQYAAKRRQVFSVGSRGSEPGCFTWPRGVATGPDNSIVVADSSNHRVQVFDSNGIFQKEFGSYGTGEGEFDCLAGIAVNRIGQFIIADRYNHRIQVMDPSGRFLRAFGSQGTADGKFNYPWGVTTDALGFIYVCDKENHRVQVFQSDGTFVGKFGSHGSKVGQLDHPHYIAVSNTNRVFVSDSNNHRVQIFDVNGRVISSFGQEGSEEGQFKFPSSENTIGRSSRPYRRSFSGPVTTTGTHESSPHPPSPLRVVRSASMTGPPTALSSGSCCGRPRLYPSWGLWEQSDSDLHVGGGLHSSVRLLGERRGRVQRIGGCSGDVQFQHPRLRSRKPPRPGLLRSGASAPILTTPTIHVFDPLISKRIMLEATVPNLSSAKKPSHITGYTSSTLTSLICPRRMSMP